MTSNRGYDTEWLQKLRDSNDLVTVASKYCYVKRQGRNFWACCPFHHEKTPSFCINQEEQFFHCFGCGESGDVISFIMKEESLDFLDAVKYLADKSGLQLPEFRGEREIFEKKQKKDRILSLLKFANTYYKNELKGQYSKEALDYLATRQLSRSEIEKFELGYSPNYSGIVKFLREKGFTDAEMLEVGMASKDDKGNLIDFFAHRLMFPLFNKFGDCIGFSGRDIRNVSRAKYKNSIQNAVFDKSSTVFALNHVKNLKRNQNIDKVIICEGQMDVIAMHKAGFNTAVACLGTALTEIHAKEIKRVADNVVLCLDGDSAGISATLRAIPILQSQDLDIRVARLDGGKDPDEVIKNHGVEYMQDIINSAIDCMEYQILAISQKHNLEDGAGKTKFLNEVFALLKTIESNSVREVYIPLVSRLSKVTQDMIKRDVLNVPFVSSQKNQSQVKPQTLQTNNPDALIQAQMFIMASLIENKEYSRKLEHDFDPLFKDPELKRVYEFIFQKRLHNEPLNKVTLYDLFGDQNQMMKNCLNFNFDTFSENLEVYFDACVKTINLKNMEFQISGLKDKLNMCENTDEKKKLIKEIANAIREKQKLSRSI